MRTVLDIHNRVIDSTIQTNMAHAHPQAMLQSTLQTMAQRDVAFATGTDVIKDWISTLKNVDEAEPVAKQLSALYDELINPQPDVVRVKQLLNTIAGHTQTLSRSLDGTAADDLGQLADSLRAFATDLDRGSNDDDLTANQPDSTPIYANVGDRAQVMFNDTLTVLSGGAALTTPEAGVLMVEDWIEVVRSDVSTQWIEAPLTQLRDALNAGDMRTTERLMRDLAGQAQDYANNSEGPFSRDLTNLATALISFAQPLS